MIMNNELNNEVKSLEQLEELYKDNPQFAEMLGGLEVFNTLFEMNEEDFIKIAPSIYQVYVETLNEPQTTAEFSSLFASGQWQIEDLEKEVSISYITIDDIEGLEDVKKDFFKRLISALANKIREVYHLKAIDIPCLSLCLYNI